MRKWGSPPWWTVIDGEQPFFNDDAEEVLAAAIREDDQEDVEEALCAIVLERALALGMIALPPDSGLPAAGSADHG